MEFILLAVCHGNLMMESRVERTDIRNEFMQCIVKFCYLRRYDWCKDEANAGLRAELEVAKRQVQENNLLSYNEKVFLTYEC